MKRLLIVLLSVIISAFIVGCSSAAVSNAPSSGSAATLTQEQREQVVEYLASDMVNVLKDGMSTTLQDAIEKTQAGDYSWLDTNALNMYKLTQAAEEIDVPPICETLHYNLLQASRCSGLALSDLAIVAKNGSSNARSEYEEALDYIEQATKFMYDYNAELERIEDLVE